MTAPRFDPRRRCLPVDGWPDNDRLAWDNACSGGDLLLDAGAASRWRPRTRELIASSYGRWMTFSWNHDEAHFDRDLVARVTPNLVRLYIEELRGQVSGMTIVIRIDGLVQALRVMAPDHDWRWLRDAALRLKARSTSSRRKADRVQSSESLWAFGRRLMREATRGEVSRPSFRSVAFRDGLIIALLASRPIRLSNLASMRIGRNLLHTSKGYRIQFSREETKTRPFEALLPNELSELMDHYLREHRVSLLNGRETDRLWITKDGAPMADRAIYQRIKKLTLGEFGVVVNPHLFRHCAATSTAIDDPEHVRILAPLLGHATIDTSNQYYNMADSLAASERHSETINRLRQKTAHLIQDTSWNHEPR